MLTEPYYPTVTLYLLHEALILIVDYSQSNRTELIRKEQKFFGYEVKNYLNKQEN